MVPFTWQYTAPASVVRSAAAEIRNGGPGSVGKPGAPSCAFGVASDAHASLGGIGYAVALSAAPGHKTTTPSASIEKTPMSFVRIEYPLLR